MTRVKTHAVAAAASFKMLCTTEGSITLLYTYDNDVMEFVKSVPPDRPERRPASPETLLDAARAIFVAEGLPSLSVRRVAEAAGCTTMAVYSWFGGKHGIMTALFDEGFTRLAEAQANVPRHTGPTERIVALCRAYRDTAHQFPHHYALMLGRFRGTFEPGQKSADKALATLEPLVAAAASLVGGELGPTTLEEDKPSSAESVARALFALSHGWVSLELAGMLPGDAASSTAEFESAVKALVAGFAERAHAATPTPRARGTHRS